MEFEKKPAAKVTNADWPLQSIRTRYLGPSNVRGSRVVAEHSGKVVRIVKHWDSALNQACNHAAAAEALAEKLGWTGELVMGADVGSSGFVFVFKPEA